MFSCPSNQDNKTLTNDRARPGFPDSTEFPISYNSNRWGIISTPTAPTSMAAVDKPASVIAITEVWAGCFPMSWGCGTAAYDGDLNYDYNGHRYSHFAGHTGTSNYVFADGHAKAMRPTATIKDNTREMWDRRTDVGARTPSTNLREMLQAAEANKRKP